jgi:arginine deiminase
VWRTWMRMDARPRERQQFAYGCEEFGRLTRVLVHTPGDALGLVDARNHRQWLFDEVPDVEAFREEHAAYCRLLEARGVEVLYLADHVRENTGLMDRLPNLVYLHDIAVITGRGAVLSKMIWPARQGEEVVLREALGDLGIPVWIDFRRPEDAFEGCLLLSLDALLVAHTERHTSGAISSFIERASEVFDDVILVDIPKARRFMHPDTVFNRIDVDLALAYLPAFEKTTLFSRGTAREVDFQVYMNGRGVELLEVSDSEQQRLACTFVPLEPGVIFHYDTALDPATVRSLERRGVELIFVHPRALRAGGGSLRCMTLRLHRETAGGVRS